MYKIVWYNEHNSGELPITYNTLEEAIEAAREWKAEMVATDENPEEASRVYSWEVIRNTTPMLHVGASKEGDSHVH